MALESFGTQTAKVINHAVMACHDMILQQTEFRDYDPDKINFKAGEEGIWSVFPSMLDGKPAVEIRLCVG